MKKTLYPEVFENPAVTVDVLLFTVENNQLKIVLVKRAEEPFRDSWSIPGGFVKKGENLEEAAIRVLNEKTGVRDVYLEQLYTFGEPNRDPRARIITVSYFALIPSKHLKKPDGEKIIDIEYFPSNKLPPLAFDHKKIVEYAVERLKNKAGYSNIVYGLLPKKFRLSDLQKMYEVILGHQLDKRNFRKRMLSLGLLEPTGEKDLVGAHRPAQLYQFKKREVVFFDQ